MNDETLKNSNTNFNTFSPKNDEFRTGNAHTTFNEPDSDLNDTTNSSITTEALVHGSGRQPDTAKESQTRLYPRSTSAGSESLTPNVAYRLRRGNSAESITVFPEHPDRLRQYMANIVTTNPANTIYKPGNLTKRIQIKQAEMANPLHRQTPPPVQEAPRTSSPVNENELDLETTFNPNITMNNTFNTTDGADLNATGIPHPSHVPEYLPPSEQIKKIHSIELAESEKQAKRANQLSKLLSILTIQNENAPPGLKELSDELKKEAEEAQIIAEKKKTCQEAANKIVEYYKSSINKPIITPPPPEYKKTFHRTSPKEITSLTGTFDPHNPNADFSHIWSKLLGYGQANYFTENEYKDALRYILQGDAYETFLSFEQPPQPLANILDYFGKVYTAKRSLNAHRQAVDNFVRLKNETLEVAMHRCQIAVDKLRIQYSPENWPETRIWLRRNILTQIITEDTRRFIRSKEDDVMENFGIPIDIDQLIHLAHKFEIQNNKAPRTELSTMFQVASGGISEDPAKMKSELNHLKKEVITEKGLRNTIMEILTNPVMTKKFSPEKDRESRQRSRDEFRHASRQSKFDRNRQSSQESRPETPASQNQPQPSAMDISPPRGPPIQRFQRIPNIQPPISSQPQYTNRSQTPIMDFRNFSDYSRGRSPSYDGRNSRYQSQDRYREYRRNQEDRNRRSSSQQSTDRRYQSRDRNNSSSYRPRDRSDNYRGQNQFNPSQNRQNFRQNSDYRRRFDQDTPRYRDQRSQSRDQGSNRYPQNRFRSNSRNRFNDRDQRQWQRTSSNPPYDRSPRDRRESPRRNHPSPYSSNGSDRNRSRERNSYRSSSASYNRADDHRKPSVVIVVNKTHTSLDDIEKN